VQAGSGPIAEGLESLYDYTWPWGGV